MGGNVLTSSIESTLDDPIHWGGDPHHGTDTLRCDHADGDVHLIIGDISVFGVNDHELSGDESRASY